jgi:hypothetical protein
MITELDEKRIVEGLTKAIQNLTEANVKLARSNLFKEESMDAEIGIAARQSYDKGYLTGVNDAIKILEFKYHSETSSEIITKLESLKEGVGDS